MSELPLAGVRVLEYAGGVAGAYCGKLFCDMGAAVTRIEPATGDPTLDWRLDPELADTARLYAAYLNAGKTILHEADDGQPDLVILGEAGARPDAPPMPRLASLDITWFGREGPYAEWAGSDLVAQALAGMSHPGGPVDGPPLFLGDHQATTIGGLAAYSAGLAALIGGETAAPAHFDISILEAIVINAEMQMCHTVSLGMPLPRMGVNRFLPTCPLSIHKCKEGWIGITPLTPTQWLSFCAVLEVPELGEDAELTPPRNRYPHAARIEAAVDARFPTRTAEEWAALGRAHKIPMATVPDARGILAHPIFNARAALAGFQAGGREWRVPRTPLRLEATPPRLDLDRRAAETNVAPLASTEDSVSPLAGLRVMDFSMGWAGPLATRMLADLGAEVIKVEAGRYPDWWRAVDWSPEAIARRQYEESRHFSVINRGKRSLSLDLTSPEGLALAKTLVANSDLVVENQAAGVMDRLGLGFAELSAGREDLIMLSMSAYGAGNAWSETRAYGSVLEQGSGLPSFCGEEGWPPTMAHLAYGDPIGGIYGGAALLTAIYHRRRTGRGQWINNTQIEAMLPFTTPALLIAQASGAEPKRRGNRHSRFVPHGIFPCAGADAWIALALTDDTAWPSLAALLGLATDGLHDVEARRAREDELEAAIAAWSRTRAPDAAAARLQAIAVAAAPVRHLHEIDTEPHLKARAFFYDIERPHIGQQWQAGLPFRRDGTRYPMRGLAPILGGDSETVLREVAGLDAAAYARLRESGIVSLKPTQLRDG